jgi:hypothetical protein
MIAKETTLAEVGEMLTHVVKHMATKEDVARLDARIDALGAKIESTRLRVPPRRIAFQAPRWFLLAL